MSGTPIIAILLGSIWQIISESSAFGIFILIILSIMSIISWIVIFQKWFQFREVERDNHNFLSNFRRTRILADSVGQAKSNSNSPMSRIFLAGYRELTELKEIKNQGGAMQEKVNKLDNDDFEIIEMTMEKTLSEEISKLEKRVIFLASTGNSAPFMGLLGTVVGIMDSFWSIGDKGTPSLSVVAPGIAEALLATIVGLATAIPAVIAYNWAKNKIKFINDFSNNFVLEFIAQAKKESM